METKSVIGYSVAGIVVLAVAFFAVEKFIVPPPATTATQVNVVIMPQPSGACALTFSWSPKASPDPTEGPDYPYWVLVHSGSKDHVLWSVTPNTKGTYTVNFADSPWTDGKSSFAVSDGTPQDSGQATKAGILCKWGWRKCSYSYTIPECKGYTGSKGNGPSGPNDPGLGVHVTK